PILRRPSALGPPPPPTEGRGAGLSDRFAPRWLSPLAPAAGVAHTGSNGGRMAESAVARHDRMGRDEVLQAERGGPTAGGPPDFWRARAKPSRAPAAPPAAPTREAWPALTGPDDDVTDGGAGGGGIAIPLSRRCRRVVAVEPSPAMRAVLEDEIARHGVRNI